MADRPYPPGNHYANNQISGGYSHLGNVINYGPSRDEQILHQILEALSYDKMNDRRDALAGPDRGTFDWTSLEGPTEFAAHGEVSRRIDTAPTTSSPNFNAWLKGDDERLFCFIGKPGAGKSTLAKHLATDPGTNAALQVWAKDSCLTRAEHFFWIFGGPLQKNLEGLLRNLLFCPLLALHQSLGNQCLDLMKHICGSRWTSLNNSRAWKCEDLKQILTRFATSHTSKYFFLVDALDECESRSGLGELADEILWISQLPNIKLCVFCRGLLPFIRRFQQNPALHLDRLTLHDMKIYVEGRLMSAEAENDRCNQFRCRTAAAEQLILQVVYAAEGVFLWLELVVRALTVELRKGSDFLQLGQILTEFPVDLDDYMHRSIYGRIPRTRRNISDTAAALKLAMVIESHAPDPRIEQWQGSSPTSKSFLNFWLLSTRRLRRGFNWMDYRSCVYRSSDVEEMLQQTRGFVEATCGDLLVLVDKRAALQAPSRQGDLQVRSMQYVKFYDTQSPLDWNVEFFHRTVFDFLCGDAINQHLLEHAPEILSEPQLIVDLAKLSHICKLNDGVAGCAHRTSSLISAIRTFHEMASKDQAWLSACEDILVSTLSPNCGCFGLMHHVLLHNVFELVGAGLTMCLRSDVSLWPYHALTCRPGFMGGVLLGSAETDINGPDMTLLRLCLRLGYDPDGTLSRTRPWHQPNAPRSAGWCEGTDWERWLTRVAMQIDRFDQRTATSSHVSPTDEDFDRFRNNNADIITLLLQHGADPACAPCMRSHPERARSPDRCSRTPFAELLAGLVPVGRVAQIEVLRASCMDRFNRYMIRRKQRLMAMRSFLTSEERLHARLSHARLPPAHVSSIQAEWDIQQARFLVKLMGSEALQRRSTGCHTCGVPGDQYSEASIDEEREMELLIWCVDCEGSFCHCIVCARRLQPGAYHPCKDVTSDPSLAVSDHTIVTVGLDWIHGGPIDEHRMPGEPSCTEAAAILKLKQWYFRNAAKQGVSIDD